MSDWLAQHPEIRALRVAACDLNGVPRGKRLPVDSAEKIASGAVRFPYSVLNLDIWGDDIADSPLVLASGDQDGVLKPTERGFLPVPWLETPTAMMPVSMFHEDGRPFDGDARHALSGVVTRFRNKGLTPVVATELEFFLIDDSQAELGPPRGPISRRRPAGGDILSLSTLDQFDGFLTALYDACAAMDIPADAALSESGLAQFEINLRHQPDALKAADDTWLFKMLVKGLARQHGFAASFLAKPYGDTAGSGLHMHFSVVDADGRNIFGGGSPAGSDTLRHAVQGCLAGMAGSTLIFAPHANSYDRMVPGAHAPTGIAWAYENRTAAIRIPSGPDAARRIEHRMAGADVNPYLMIAAVLGAALSGIEEGRMPPAPITGNAYALNLPQVPRTWKAAIDAFETCDVVQTIFPEELIRNLLFTKRQEIDRMAPLAPQEQRAIYLDTV